MEVTSLSQSHPFNVLQQSFCAQCSACNEATHVVVMFSYPAIQLMHDAHAQQASRSVLGPTCCHSPPGSPRGDGGVLAVALPACLILIVVATMAVETESSARRGPRQQLDHEGRGPFIFRGSRSGLASVPGPVRQRWASTGPKPNHVKQASRGPAILYIF